MSAQATKDNQSAPASSLRKPYVLPDIIEYGSLADITLMINGKGGPDGGTPSTTNKTKP